MKSRCTIQIAEHGRSCRTTATSLSSSAIIPRRAASSAATPCWPRSAPASGGSCSTRQAVRRVELFVPQPAQAGRRGAAGHGERMQFREARKVEMHMRKALCLLFDEDARTLFHEFGHALHSMLSDVTYERVSGTSVARRYYAEKRRKAEHEIDEAGSKQYFQLDRMIERLSIAPGGCSDWSSAKLKSRCTIQIAEHGRSCRTTATSLSSSAIISLDPASGPARGALRSAASASWEARCGRSR